MYSFTVKELKDWVSKIPAVMDFEQVSCLNYDGDREPILEVNIMFKKKLMK